MKNIFWGIIACLLTACTAGIHTPAIKHNETITVPVKVGDMLLGTWPADVLGTEPYNAWFRRNYADYKIDSATANTVKPFLKNKKIQIFLGTWCGDSRREVPRMLKLLHYCGVNKKDIQLVFVNNVDSAYKQSPAHEEKGKFIFRVPDLLVYDKDEEIGRIVESPVVSLEQDLLSIVKKESYQPNYKAAYTLSHLLSSQMPDNSDKEIAELVSLLKPMITYAGELNSLGRILLNENEYKKAVTVFKVNSNLFPADITAKEKLATALWKTNDLIAAQQCCNEILAQYPNNETASAILKKINN